MPPPARLYRFAYYVLRKNGRPHRIHQLRDGAAFSELRESECLRPLDYQGPLLNVPPVKQPKLDPDEVPTPTPVDTSFLGPQDLICSATRHPLDDRRHGDRFCVEPSYTTLEAAIFAACRRCFEICARSHVKLTPEFAALLPADVADRADVCFHVHRHAAYKELRRPGSLTPRVMPRDERRTAGYVLRVEELWENGPGLLACFAMRGPDGLVLAHRLRRDLSYLIASPGFAMVEIETQEIPARALTLDFAKDWNVEVLLHQTF